MFKKNFIKNKLNERYCLYKILHNVWKIVTPHPVTLKRPIFIIGCPRSGTTITNELFKYNPEIAVWSEAGFIWEQKDYYNKNIEHYWSKKRATELNRNFIHSKFEWYRRFKKGSRFLNKFPRNAVRLEYLTTLFPDAYFIHVIRDGRAVVNSIVNKIQKDKYRQNIPFGNFCRPKNYKKFLNENLIIQSAHQWNEILTYIMECKENCLSRYHEIKYEELCESPRPVIKEAMAFAKIKVSQSTLEKIPPKLKNMNYKFKQDLSKQEIETINEIQNSLLKRFHYL